MYLLLNARDEFNVSAVSTMVWCASAAWIPLNGSVEPVNMTHFARILLIVTNALIGIVSAEFSFKVLRHFVRPTVNCCVWCVRETQTSHSSECIAFKLELEYFVTDCRTPGELSVNRTHGARNRKKIQQNTKFEFIFRLNTSEHMLHLTVCMDKNEFVHISEQKDVYAARAAGIRIGFLILPEFFFYFFVSLIKCMNI